MELIGYVSPKSEYQRSEQSLFLNAFGEKIVTQMCPTGEFLMNCTVKIRFLWNISMRLLVEVRAEVLVFLDRYGPNPVRGGSWQKFC